MKRNLLEVGYGCVGGRQQQSDASLCEAAQRLTGAESDRRRQISWIFEANGDSPFRHFT
jgi:hypothetical protein